MNQPLYDRLVDRLKEKIESTLQVHEKLSSERELVKEYQVSRTTVRQALLELERLGYIYKVHGKGTFVADNKLNATNLATMYSFTDKMLQEGKVPTTKVLSFEKIQASKRVSHVLNVSIEDFVYKIKRVRLANDQPMMVETTYLPVDVCQGLTKEKVESKALYTIFEECEQIVKMAEEEIFASIMRYKEAMVLEVPLNSPALYLSRLAYNQRNQVVEWTQSVARADLFKYTITHYNESL
ncbi:MULTISPECIES: GntR family transcriptional regulator [unclassified Granulicatella]|uniref:GntR family transcriptional regulator n=1 Tax=unclassified Granulicatella TaxID=2630493 RepID=UPI0010746973|nr:MULTISPECIES: GntR family transcriptional regulator [unclassified Granulicatella]MBF0779961.1 GntR family transcriptional regulator [Granulicatella sp. 19428wC4_WM01]TFU95977.1 GntR family transcriptional regulator [Granulicatella sp. WM01]